MSTSEKLRTRMLIGFFGLTSLIAAKALTASGRSRSQTRAGNESVGMIPTCVAPWTLGRWYGAQR